MSHDVLVRIATRDPGTSRTDDVNSKEHGRLVIMCGKGGAGKLYTVDSVLYTVLLPVVCTVYRTTPSRTHCNVVFIFW